MIAAEQQINGHQYQLTYDFRTASVVPGCTCGWIGRPWRPEQGSRARIEQAAAVWHVHAETAAPITREKAAS